MGKVIFIIFAIIFSYNIIRCTGFNRLVWFFAAVLFFQNRILLIQSPTALSFQRLLIYVLVLIELAHPKAFYSNLRNFPLIKSLTIVFVGMLCIGFFDTRHSAILNIYRSIDEFIQSFFILFLTYNSYNDNVDWNKVIKFILRASIVLSIYGLFNFVTKSNPIDTFISQTYNSISSFQVYSQVADRFRVNSLASHPIYYGYLCGILLLFAIYSYFFITDLKKLSLIVIPLIFTNLLLSNSRTPIITFAAGLLIFIAIGFNYAMKVKFLIISVLLFLIVGNISFIREDINNAIDIFKTGGQKVSGSTLDMREMQFNASYKEFLKSPVVGNGLYYINENLGWNSNPNDRMSDDDFEGFESYIYHLLIEQGLTGILINVIFFASLVVYFLECRLRYREFSGLGLSMVLMFLIFVIATGTIGNSWVISMGLIGVIIKQVEMVDKISAQEAEPFQLVLA